MKSWKIMVLVGVLIVSLTGCQRSSLPAQYEFYSVSLQNVSEVNCPQIRSETVDCAAINTCIAEETERCLAQLLGEYAAETTIRLNYTITFADADILCLLYEGYISQAQAVHPTYTAFPVCISIPNATVVKPSSLVETDDNFWIEFREQLVEQNNNPRFSEDQWAEIVDYINAFSDDELQKILSSAVTDYMALGPGTVIVLVPVPHAIGDYIKIEVPYSWQDKLLS